MTIDLRALRVGVVGTFPPTRCGVANFSHALCRTWRALAPNLDLRVNRIVTGSDVMAPEPMLDTVFDPCSPAAVRSVSRRLELADVALVHHEFGIYGPGHGRAVVDLVRDVSVPVVSVLHTVLSRPRGVQQDIVEALARSGPLVVHTGHGREELLAHHRIDRGAVQVIGHGTSWRPAPINPRPRRKVISWGLLGPGKGIERVLEALASVELDPPVTYEVVGQTHPRVRERFGERYRHSLEELTRYLGLERRVRFLDRYLSDEELTSRVATADLAVIPYDDRDQFCSGTLLDALALGRPAVATAFPHARELLADGAGLAIEPAPDALANAIATLLEDEDAYRIAAARAAERASPFAWESVSHAYARALHRAASGVGVA